jgi:hypothetical protein
MPDLPITGGCLCGAVRFEVTEPFVASNYCHCTRCQRRTGTSSSANARAAPGSFHLTAGEEHVKTWTPDEGFEKAFCAECGGHLFSRDPADPDQVGVRLGAVDGDPGIRPQQRNFVAYAAVWEDIPDDGLPRHAERP